MYSNQLTIDDEKNHSRFLCVIDDEDSCPNLIGSNKQCAFGASFSHSSRKSEVEHEWGHFRAECWWSGNDKGHAHCRLEGLQERWHMRSYWCWKDHYYWENFILHGEILQDRWGARGWCNNGLDGARTRTWYYHHIRCYHMFLEKPENQYHWHVSILILSLLFLFLLFITFY